MSATKLPLLRRSSSSSNIPRLSRTTTRPSNLIRQARGKNVVDRFSVGNNLNFLNVNLGTLGRSRSSSNLKETSTPLQRRTVSPWKKFGSATSSASKDSRPISDKEWQRNQMTKIKAVLQELDPQLPPLKPLTGNLFVETMNLLLRELDDRIIITMETYKDEVPRFLKIYGYPGSVKPSLMKTISVPHNWPQVIAIWSWLVDRIYILRNPEPILFPPTVDIEKLQIYHILLNYITNKYKFWNNGVDCSTANRELEDNLCKLYKIGNLNIDYGELNIMKKQVIKFRETYKNTLKNVEEKQEKIATSKNENEKYYKNKQAFLAQTSSEKVRILEKLKKTNETIDKVNVQKLKQKLMGQTCSYEEKLKLIKQIDELKHTLQLREERIDVGKKLVTNYDLELAELKKLLESTIYHINNKFFELSLIRPEVKNLKIRESAFSRPDMIDQLNLYVQRRQALELELNNEYEEQDKQLAELTTLLKQEISERDTLCFSVNELKAKETLNQKQLEELTVKKESELESLTDKLKTLELKLSDVIKHNSELIEAAESNLLKATHKKSDLEKAKTIKIKQGKTFFTTIAKAILKSMDDNNKMALNLNKATVEASKCFLEHETVTKLLTLPVAKH